MFIGLSLKPIIANAQDIVWDKTVEKDKPWTIKFNKEIVFDESTKKEISIKDSKETAININITLGADNKSIYVTPETSYIEGETYKLIISPNIYDKKNIKLKEGSNITFKIKEAAKIQTDYTAKGYIYRRQFKFEESKTNLNKGVVFTPKNAAEYSIRSLTYMLLRQNDKAETDIDKVIEMNPKATDA
ncbi:hypothetical protein CLHOM_27330 [Clostridium homopropionicum DSM 5847]|uniref:SbsA Ig-like domain-containing protein n=1 Tax=Clostridium homopropionicum DSM 5847 TaxID=1121318 RepID=A0A0L6Z858_9CLOT|nr:Ig-like domain-containing protein [Clostridium homopropionicum]KOA18993.1 hypothetical protein CLHOM_27330 [Clostridium homopropionicum DSM 5847]SFG42341.1 hypothetical protein SAMN04488501_10920 [Clostridium homopropionicum]